MSLYFFKFRVFKQALHSAGGQLTQKYVEDWCAVPNESCKND